MLNAAAQKLAVDRLDKLLADYKVLVASAKHGDLSDLPASAVQHLLIRIRSAVESISGLGSTYSGEIRNLCESKNYARVNLMRASGIASGLRDDVNDGYLASFGELLRAELFSDFLEMASHLLDEGYKDPAAVVAGSSLEAHLRSLCDKHGISTQGSDGKPKKADALNSELAKGAYGKLDQKSVTGWLDLRNKAAHGHYAEYTKEQVALMLASIRDFLVRNPA